MNQTRLNTSSGILWGPGDRASHPSTPLNEELRRNEAKCKGKGCGSLVLRQCASGIVWSCFWGSVVLGQCGFRAVWFGIMWFWDSVVLGQYAFKTISGQCGSEAV